MKEKMVPSINVNNYDGSKVIVVTVIIPWSENNGKRIEAVKQDILNKIPCAVNHITYPGL